MLILTGVISIDMNSLRCHAGVGFRSIPEVLKGVKLNRVEQLLITKLRFGIRWLIGWIALAGKEQEKSEYSGQK
ncbi:hypothetical protein GCM10027164_28310 [Algoriphagus taiwanensis]